MKALVVATVSAIALLLCLPVSADNLPRGMARTPVTIQLHWGQNGMDIAGTYSYAVPAGQMLVIETLSARVLEPGDYLPGDGTTLNAVPAYLRLEVDATGQFFIPLVRQGGCAEGGFQCGDTVKGTLVGAENVRLYASQGLEGDIYMMSNLGGAEVLLLISGYLLPESSGTLGP